MSHLALNPKLWLQVPSTRELHQEGHRLLPTNAHLALQCFTAAVARGHGPSHAQLAFMHFKGYFGADKNVDRARKLAAAGAALGCSDSQGVLGLLTHEDETDNGVPEDKEVGERLIKESADAGSAWGQWALGLLHMEWGSEEAPDHFLKATEQEHSDAQFHLGDWFAYYVDDPNPNEAARYYRLAAEQGHPEAQFRLGNLFQSGNGVACDHSEAARYYRMAAEQGISAAQCQLGQLYENGIGVAQDFAEAARYYRMARAQGHAGAARALCNILADDRGRV
jgi:TPR repeat protein